VEEKIHAYRYKLMKKTLLLITLGISLVAAKKPERDWKTGTVEAQAWAQQQVPGIPVLSPYGKFYILDDDGQEFQPSILQKHVSDPPPAAAGQAKL
jgi:hypothetical protein